MNDQAATLRLAVFPRSGLLTDALLVLGGAAFVGLAAQISFHLGFTPVPITARPSPCCSSARPTARCSARRACSLYLLLGIAGVPLYADHKHGWDVFSGATGGYIVGFVLAAALTGLPRRARLGPAVLVVGHGDAHRQRRHLRLRRCLAAPLLGVSWNTTLVDGVYPFVPGDIVKLYLAARGASRPRGSSSAASGASRRRRAQHRELVGDLERPRAEAVERRRPAADGPGSRRVPVGTSRWRRSEHALEVRRRDVVAERGAVEVA